uniref:Alpha-(1,6)-fucosyltransferase n=1 Tax=Schistosoma haematobium TaxID=6185 RepID=A0A095A2D5_SCHHA
MGGKKHRNFRRPKYEIMRESTSIRTNKKDQITNVDRIGISHETLRRRVLNYFHEARYTLNNLRNIFTQLKKVNQKELDTETVSSIQASLVRYRQNMEETISHLQLILNKLGELDEFSHMRKNGLNKLSQRLQEKIQKQQNPSDCKKAKYMTFDFTNLCGLGCCMHQLMYCLQLALENERVLVLKKHYPGDIFREWLHQNMLPLSDKCSYLDSDGRSDNINCPWIVKAPQVHNWLPHVLPIDMNKELLRLHEAPFVWFAGQLAAYILRPKPQFAQLINVTLKSFKTSGDPVVGVHIRRTDKNPSDCKKAKYMTFDFTNLCGLGCCMHQLMYCLQLALENERVLVLKKHYPGDIFREWLHQNMLPLSDKCSYLDSDGRSDNINCPWIVKAPQVHNWLPHVLPIDMNKELLRLHEAPFVWFAGQLAAYILRPKPQFAQLINVTLKSFKTSGDPVVGVHIRRTDKLILEAQFHNLSEYMEHVNNFFDLQSVNLLTMSKRHVCRLAYELMQTRHMDLGDATQLFHSIDKSYHEEDYGRLKFNVIIPDMKVNLKYGDVVEIVKTYWNGSLLVKLVQSSEDIHNKNQKGMKNDLFIAPAYKLRPIINMTGFN